MSYCCNSTVQKQKSAGRHYLLYILKKLNKNFSNSVQGDLCVCVSVCENSSFKTVSLQMYWRLTLAFSGWFGFQLDSRSTGSSNRVDRSG